MELAEWDLERACIKVSYTLVFVRYIATYFTEDYPVPRRVNLVHNTKSCIYHARPWL